MTRHALFISCCSLALAACHFVAFHSADPPSDGGGFDLTGDARIDLAADGAPREAGGDLSDAAGDGAGDLLIPDALLPDVLPPDVLPPDAWPTPGTWVVVPPGKFIMGSPSNEPCRATGDDAKNNEVTQHEVTLTRGFAIQSTEVTQAQFESLLSYQPGTWGNYPDYPVEHVTWYEAAAYCNALSDQVGLARCYDCSGVEDAVTCTVPAAYGDKKIYDCPGFRLPTEAEWEYAYRAGKKSAYYNGANPTLCDCGQDANLLKIGRYCAITPTRPQNVGQLQPNDWGLYDMAGNVWEWCHDKSSWLISTTSAVDPVGTAWSNRILRGGSWGSPASELRASFRQPMQPGSTGGADGFRCVRTLLP